MRSVYRFGAVIVAALIVGTLGYAASPKSNTWSSVGSLSSARANAATVLLYDGRVLIAGGRSADGVLRSADLFTRGAGFSAAGEMLSERSGHAAVVLFDGRVLVTGGVGADGMALNSAEIYDPSTGDWHAVPASMAEARADHTATLLADGRVLIAGGDIAGVPSATFEVFDPTVEQFHVAGVLSAPRMQHAAALISGGRVLIAGGTDGNVPLASVDVVDADAGWVGQATMAEPRAGLTATALLDGRVLVAGGANTNQELTSAEIFDPATGSFTPTDSTLTAARRNHLAFLLPHNNQVLIVGGLAGGNPVATAEYFTPWDGSNGTFCGATVCANGYAGPAAMANAHASATGSALSFPASAINRSGPGDGLLLVAGGSDQPSAELFGFATVKTDRDDYAPGTTVAITGSGWQPYESVALVLVEEPLLDTHPLVSVTADANGNIISTEFSPDQHDLNIRFMLTAFGTVSEAQTTFTDGTNLQLKGSDGNAHSGGNNEQNLGSIAKGTTLSVACPSGLTLKATGLGGSGTQNWSIAYNSGPGTAPDNSTLAPLTTLTPSGGTVIGNDTACIGMTINTNSLTAGTTYHGSLQANGSGASSDFYFFSFSVTSGCTAPTVSLQPISQTVTYGQASASFVATANGSPAPTVQWQLGAGGNFTNIAGATGTTLTIDSPTVAQSGTQYRAVFTNTCGGTQTATSSPATLTVNKATAAVTVTPYTVTYDGHAHTAAVTSIIGVNGETGATVGTVDVSNTTHTGAGTYSSDTWSFTGAANYNNIAATTITDAITKANAAVVVTPYTVTYDGQPHTATVTSITGVNGETGATVGTVTLNTTHTNAATYAGDSWSFTGAANYSNIAATTITDAITKANAAVVVTPYTVTYDGQPHTATVASITGVNGETGSTVGTVTLNTTHTNAATYAGDSWSFTGAANYSNIAATTITDTITKATASVVVTPYTVTYDGQPHTATVTSITGVNGETGATVGAVTLNTTHTNAATYASDSWSFTGAANYADIVSTTITDTITKASASVVVTPYTVTYDGQPHSATVTSITGVNGETGATVGVVTLNTSHTNAATYASDSWSFTGAANYVDIASTTITDTITKASASVVVTPYTVTYDGQPHTATVTSITGVNGETGATVGAVTLNTTHTNAATYASDSWSFTGAANYADIVSTTITDTITKANAAVVVTPYTVVYDGQPHSAAVTSIMGVHGETGSTVGAVTLNTTHTNAATYASDSWSFTGAANYADIASTTITDTITKASASVVVTPYTVTYDGQPHTATVMSITGVNGEAGATVGAVTLNTTHTNAATYASDSWSFTGAANYADIVSTTITDTINKASASVVVTPYTVVYDGQPHSAAVTSITGVNGEAGATVGAVTLNTTHTNAATYASDSWSFTGAANYVDIASTTITDTITKASANVVVTPYTVVYDGHQHTATVTISGVNGETGATVGSVDVSSTTHVNAATFSDTWSFTSANYSDIPATPITDTIKKANATVVVAPYTVTYDGQPHTSTATITGVNGETGATVGTVNLSNTTHTVAGTYSGDSWSFTPTDNYYYTGNTAITNTINKANATVVVTPYTVTYDGHAHTATVTIMGVNSEMGAAVGTVTLNTTHTSAGSYASDSWSFTGAANYNNIAVTAITDTINKATATIVVTPYTVIYDGKTHTATISSIAGVNGETGATVGTVDVSSTTHTNPGTYADTWSFTGANYNNIPVSAATTITDTIGYGACGAGYGPGGVIMQPINVDGSSVYQRKGGSTIPVKFTVCDADGMPISNAGAVFLGGNVGSLTMLSAVRGTVDVINEGTITDIPDAAFRWSGDKWIFNMATSNLSSGTTYTFRINLALGSIQFQVGVK
jgi:hypothetical protein